MQHLVSIFSDFQEHCRRHLAELDMFCGLLQHRNVVFIAGRCPFHLSRRDLPWDEGLVEFDDAAVFSDHLELHFKELRETACPHPLCDGEEKFSQAGLKEHLDLVHGIEPYRKRRRSSFVRGNTKSPYNVPARVSNPETIT
jgi:hypothetical protein